MFKRVNHEVLKGLMAGRSASEGALAMLQFVREGLQAKTFEADQFSYLQIGLALGAIDPYDISGSFRALCEQAVSTENVRPERMLTESNPGLYTNAFQIITGELISSKIIAGYEMDEGWIGDRLVTVMPGQRIRNQRIVGITALGGPETVLEGQAYTETGFEEKYVTTSETKKGRILSLNEELLVLDQTGEINRRAMMLGHWVRQERERTIVRGVTDADQGSGTYVYRPLGVGTALYSGTNMNYVGSGGLTGFNSAVALENWTDLDHVMQFRATKVTDDRVDGTKRAIIGLNSPRNVLLVPEAKRMTAAYIKGATNIEKVNNSAVDVTHFNNIVGGMIGDVLSSPFLDEVSADDWHYGDFQKQFVWTEIWPVQTFTQGRDSEAAFDRDVALRVKVRYWGGISATEKFFVTKVDGA